MSSGRSCASDALPALHLNVMALLRGAVLAVPFLLGACSTFNEGFAPVDQQLMRGEIAAAQASHDKLTYPARDRALQALHRGMLLRLSGDWTASNAALETAKGQMEELARLSVTEQATGLVSNDELRAYEGQVHERVYLHLIKAINYQQLGELHSARVEVLQLDVLMRELAAQDEKAVARVAPFARYFSGLIYDALNETSDAMIAYRQALAAYRERNGTAGIPVDLQQRVLRLTRRLGLTEEHEQFRAAFSQSLEAPRAGAGELVILVFEGLAPALREESIMWQSLFHGGRLFRISLPVVARRYYAGDAPVLHDGPQRITGELVDDLNRLVEADLEARKPAMAARSVARQALKQGVATAASKAVQRKADSAGEHLFAGVFSIGMQVASVLTERADTRNWSTLPGRVWLIRRALPVGKQSVTVEFGGRQQTWSEVNISAGQTALLSWHPMGPGGALAK